MVLLVHCLDRGGLSGMNSSCGLEGSAPIEQYGMLMDDSTSVAASGTADAIRSRCGVIG